MISLKQFEVYKKYYGDGDMFQRFGTRKEKKIMDGFEWSTFYQIVQDIYMVYSSQVSEEYKARVIAKLNEIVIEQKLRDNIIEYSQRLKEVQEEYKKLLSKWL